MSVRTYTREEGEMFAAQIRADSRRKEIRAGVGFFVGLILVFVIGTTIAVSNFPSGGGYTGGSGDDGYTGYEQPLEGPLVGDR